MTIRDVLDCWQLIVPIGVLISVMVVWKTGASDASITVGFTIFRAVVWINRVNPVGGNTKTRFNTLPTLVRRLVA